MEGKNKSEPRNLAQSRAVVSWKDYAGWQPSRALLGSLDLTQIRSYREQVGIRGKWRRGRPGGPAECPRDTTVTKNAKSDMVSKFTAAINGKLVSLEQETHFSLHIFQKP